MKGEEVKDLQTLSKIKSTEEMMPKPLARAKGRPALTEEHFKTVEDCLRLDFTVLEACDIAGIGAATFYKYYLKDADFKLRMDRARDFPKQLARTTVMRRIMQGDAKTALRFLELRDKKRYNSDIGVVDDEELNEDTESKVQFISVASNGGQNTTNPDIQNDTKQNGHSEGYANSGEKQTPRENEEEALKRLDSLNFSNG